MLRICFHKYKKATAVSMCHAACPWNHDFGKHNHPPSKDNPQTMKASTNKTIDVVKCVISPGWWYTEYDMVPTLTSANRTNGRKLVDLLRTAWNSTAPKNRPYHETKRRVGTDGSSTIR